MSFLVSFYLLSLSLNVHITKIALFQVNAGPLAYAEAFLSEDVVGKYKEQKVEALKDVYR